MVLGSGNYNQIFFIYLTVRWVFQKSWGRWRNLSLGGTVPCFAGHLASLALSLGPPSYYSPAPTVMWKSKPPPWISETSPAADIICLESHCSNQTVLTVPWKCLAFPKLHISFHAVLLLGKCVFRFHSWNLTRLSSSNGPTPSCFPSGGMSASLKSCSTLAAIFYKAWNILLYVSYQLVRSLRI